MSTNSMDRGILRWREQRVSRFSRLVSAIDAAWRAARARQQRRRSMSQLAALSDHTLKDVGLSRSEIASIAHWNESDRTRFRNVRDGNGVCTRGDANHVLRRF